VEQVPPTALQRAAIQSLWQKGVLVWKLDSAQKKLHAEVQSKAAAQQKRLVLLASRGWGKSFTLLLLAFEACLKKPHQMVAYVTKTKKQARANLRQSAETILRDCPRHLRPTYLKNESEYVFPNGSVLSLVGVDSERFDFLRGRALDGVCIDESQDIDDLDTVVRVVLDPCVLRRKGWMILAGTVPQRDTHDFVGFIREAHGNGLCVTKTILECPRYTPEDIELWMERAGGADSNVWKREYLCELTFSDERAVIPEWTAVRAQTLVREEVRPAYADLYVGLDFGFARDLTVAIFGYWDFAKAALVVEDELVLKGCTTSTLAMHLQEKLTGLWGPVETRPEVRQFADGNEGRTIYELKVLHKLRFQATDKKGKKAEINALRILVAEGRLIVNPRCKTLIRTLFSATWAKNFNTFDRDDGIGHSDALDGLLYLSRNINQRRMPEEKPVHWTQAGIPKQKEHSQAAATVGACFGPTKTTGIRKAIGGKLGRRKFL
jgi:hypothetical protein